jgi:RAMP superfamily protein
MNPYDFVRLPDRVVRESVLTHEMLRGRSGRIRCSLTAITPIFIPETQAGGGTQFITARYNGGDFPVIPGSSLKGVVRCVAEAVSQSCIGLSAQLFERGAVREEYRGAITKDFATCDVGERLCPACRLFGMVSRNSHFLGKVSFGEARTTPQDFKRGTTVTLKPLMEPKPRHSAFYLPTGKVAGRKFYFHHVGALKTASQPTTFTKTLTPLEGLDQAGNPQTVLEFDVTFSNLTDYEYSLLLFSLILTDDMRHKVGGGKPLGLGTSRIEVTELWELDTTQRYRGLGARALDAGLGRVQTGTDLLSHLLKLTEPFISAPSPSVLDLQRIWRYPPAKSPTGEPVDYTYPDQKWFAENSSTPISGTP